ncbi:Cobalamin biosynthesis protein CbiG [Methanonatronarchaeum thermophilum]|uniref:Cobalamin biosynthesis protein CbiG n=2 Tax=Methanonatronarchaeum thermophilum TaxID=1927129 RepID=A0A1Y3GA27_9EURY|nr:Cobalamin biosynthesis protein CbiG [Methanonatronarchaeum thermophilum]
MALGIVIRKTKHQLKNKWKDTPIIVVDRNLNHAIPVTGGHHGANQTTLKLHKKLGLYPAITTATEASQKPSLEEIARKHNKKIKNKPASKKINSYILDLQTDLPIIKIDGPRTIMIEDNVAILHNPEKTPNYIIGVGARKNIKKQKVIDAVKKTLQQNNLNKKQVTALATADIKEDEEGIKKAAQQLELPLLIVPKKKINQINPPSKSRAEDLGYTGVAEPTALATSIEKKLIQKKTAFDDVTTAIAR